MSATSNRKSTSAILAAIKAALEAAMWTPDGGEPQPAFPQVKLFDIANLPAAFTQLLASEQRVCFVIADSEQFLDTQSGSMKFILTRKLPVAVLLSDRVTGDRITALYGGMSGAAKILGAEGMKELALTAVTGQLLANPAGVVCKPTSSAVIHLEDKKNNMPGRACVELDLECTGGVLTADLGPGRNL